jgi:hypothetical protein
MRRKKWQKGVFSQIMTIFASYTNRYEVMSTGNMIRFVCILLLWVGLCWLLLTRAARIDFMVIFTIVASGIIVFVPLYKKYVRKK